MKNTKALFLHHLTALSNQLTASSLQDNPALWLYQNNARTTLFYLEGMTRELAGKLAGKGIKNRDDLAELAVDELVEMTGIDEERAKELILKARAHWFE